MSETILPGIKLFDLTDRVAIITGGSKGLGLAMGAGLASAGANLILVSRNQDEGQAAAEEVSNQYKVEATALGADVTSQAQMEKMAQTVLDKHGKIDILINSAGINVRGAIDEVSYQDFKQVMQVNVDGTWLATRAVIPAMKNAKKVKLLIWPVPWG